MTMRHDSTMREPAEPRPSLLPFDPADLVALRVSPAQFARMCDVSKQSVSQWIKQGKVTIGPDGKMDPAKAARQVFERSDPGRLRARVFKAAMASRQDLRGQVQELRDTLKAERAATVARVADAAQAARNECFDVQARQLSDLQDAIVRDFEALAEARASGLLLDGLDLLVARIFYPDALAEAAADDNSSPDAADTPQEIVP